MLDDRARVVVICSSDGWAGTEKWTLRSSEELYKRNRRVLMLVRRPILFSGRVTVNVPYLRVPMRNEADIFSLRRMVRLIKRNADVVVVTRVRDYWLGGLAAKLAGVPVVLRLGVVRRLRDSYIMDKMRYGKLPQRIMVNAQAIKDSLVKSPWIDPDKVHIIYNGADIRGHISEENLGFTRQLIGVPPDSTLIIGAGRLAVEKRWEWLIKATSILVAEGYNINVRIIGRGSEGRDLQNLIFDYKIQHHVQLPGERRDSHLWLSAADIVAMPSENEGISNTLLEAMGAEVPVLAMKCGGNAETFTDGENISLCEIDDFDDFVNRLRILVKDRELRERIGKAGFEVVKERFSWERMTDEYEALLDLTASEGRK